MMIVREWRAAAETTRADEYPRHFERDVIPALSRIDGFVRASLSARRRGEETEFVVLSVWRDMEAVRAFAGEDPDTAVVAAAAAAALVRFDRTVSHFEVLADHAA